MAPGQPKTPLSVVALVVVAGLATCAIAAATFAPVTLGSVGAWPVLIGGIVALIASLTAVWTIQRRRDRTLR